MRILSCTHFCTSIIGSFDKNILYANRMKKNQKIDNLNLI
jgi:hypothetical protein